MADITVGDALLMIGGDTGDAQKSIDELKGHTEASLADLSKKAGKAMTVIGAAITGTLGFAANSAISFQSKLAEVGTLGIQDMAALEAAIKNVSREFGQDLIVATQAAYQAISAGASEAEVPYLLEQAAKAATAGISDLATAVELGTSVSNAFGLEIRNVESVFDAAFVAVKGGVTTFEELSASVGKVAPVMSAAGLTTEEMFAAVAALTKGGISTTESVTALSAAVQGIITPGGDAARIAEELGFEFNITAARAMGLDKFLQQVQTATGGNIETMAKLFPNVNGLKAALALAGSQAESFSGMLNEMNTASGQTAEAFQYIVDNDPTFAFRQLKAEIHILWVEIGEALIPSLLDIVQYIKPIIASITDWIQNNKELANAIIIAVGAVGAILTVLGPLLMMLPGIVIAVKGVGLAFAGIGLAAMAPVAAFVGAVGLLITAGWMLYEAWDGVKEGLEIIWDVIAATPQVAMNVMTKLIFEPLGNMIQMWVGVWQGFVGIVQWAWDKIKGIFAWIVDGIAWVLGGLGSLASGALSLLGLGGGGIEPIPAFAGGGVMGVTGPAILGEHGAELVLSPTLAKLQGGARVFSAEDTAQLFGSGSGTTLNINIDGMVVREEADIQRISRELYDLSRRELEAKGNAY